MHTITLEILRPGPPEGQLLSPLTQYIAVCDNHPPELLQLTFDQRVILDRLGRLRYEEGRPAREADLREAADLVNSVFNSLKGFRHALSERSRSGKLVHVRLILNASEMANIPFELAYAPLSEHGVTGLSISGNTRVILTRETRHDTIAPTEWVENPNILFVTAAPGGTDAPVSAHLAALEGAFRRLSPKKEEGNHPLITVLHRATLEDIQQACDRKHFTWVHILAHGAPLRGNDGRFGLLLHSAQSSEGELIQADQLANALRRPGDAEVIRGPAVVSLAVCDAGNVGDLTYSDASLAHRLHEKEVPLVFASQFPLTWRGSVVMTEAIYDGLVRGVDPRTLVGDVRRALYEKIRETHDWASLVAYAHLPPDIDLQALRVHVDATRHAMDMLATQVDGPKFIDALPNKLPATEKLQEFEGFLSDLDRFLKQVERLDPLLRPADLAHLRLKTLTALANGCKRLAAIYRLKDPPSPGGPTKKEQHWLRESSRHYLGLASTDGPPVWAMTQAVTLWGACIQRQVEKDDPSIQKMFADLWRHAWQSTRWQQHQEKEPIKLADLAAQHVSLALVATTGCLGGSLKKKGEKSLKIALSRYKKAARGLLSSERGLFRLHLNAREFCRIAYWWWQDCFRPAAPNSPDSVPQLFQDYRAWAQAAGISFEDYFVDPR